MTILQAVILGLVQGCAEFLPISSSGHLVLARALVPGSPEPDLAFDVFLHLGTTLSTVVVFRAELAPLVRAAGGLFRPESWRRRYVEDPSFRMLVLLALSAIPAGVVGISFRKQIAALDERPEIAAMLLVVTGAWLALASFAQRRAAAVAEPAPGAAPAREPGAAAALWIGIAQAVAILPGISRSGATLGAGLLLGLRRDVVGPFAFLMSIAPILGAAALEARGLGGEAPIAIAPLVAGVGVAFLAGVLALKILLPFVRRGRLEAFAAYCLLVGPLAYFRIAHAG
jgi:undecaprenyl-diphosphatase